MLLIDASEFVDLFSHHIAVCTPIELEKHLLKHFIDAQRDLPNEPTAAGTFLSLTFPCYIFIRPFFSSV